MKQTLAIKDLCDLQEMDTLALRSVCGGSALAFLFGGRSGAAPSPIVSFNIANLEVNNFDITNNIDKLIQQTNNQLQLSQIQVSAGDGAEINVLSGQDLNGNNSSNA